MEDILEIQKTSLNYKVNPNATWLGEVPNNWVLKKMKYLFRDVSIKNKPKATLLSVTQNQGVVPRNMVESRMVMPSGNLQSFKFISKGDFAISLRSFEGGLEYCYHDGIISPAYTVLKATDSIVSNYYKYLFKSTRFISELQTSIVGIREGKNISYEELCHSIIPLPSLSEQTAIANFLDRKTALIDKAISIKEKQIELLKERRQILIHKAVTRGLNPKVKMKDSGVEWIGEVPEHWKVKRIKEVANVYGRIGFRGYTTADLVLKGEGVITISPSNIKEDEMVFNQCSYLSWYKYNESPEIQIKNNDILMVKTGSTYGKIGIVKELPIDATINPQLIVFKNIKLPADFFYECLKALYIKKYVESVVIGSTIPTISESKILKFKIVIPPNSEIKEILNSINDIKDKFKTLIKIKVNEIDKLDEYKSTLINSAVTGKIKVS